MCVLPNMSYKFYYYCFVYLSFFEERKVLYVNKRTRKRHEYLKIYKFNNCIDIKTLKLFFFNWWNHISNRFQFKEIKYYLVSNQFWNEQKSFFSLWKRLLNDVRVKIRCYETRISWAVKDIKKSSFLIIRSAIYYWNRC